jgi:hypothetical protein
MTIFLAGSAGTGGSLKIAEQQLSTRPLNLERPFWCYLLKGKFDCAVACNHRAVKMPAYFPAPPLKTTSC